MIHFFYKITFFYLSSFIICIFTYYSYCIIIGSDIIKNYYWIYRWYYPIQYITILAVIFSLAISLLINIIKKISNRLVRISILIIIFLFIIIFVFLGCLILYNIHDKGFPFDSEAFQKIVEHLFGWGIILLPVIGELLLKLLPIIILDIILGLLIIELYIFKNRLI